MSQLGPEVKLCRYSSGNDLMSMYECIEMLA